MAKGKSLCKLLKKIREQIAEANGIDYASRKCTFEGDCKGTCPACERELEYLESQLTMKRSMGVPIKIIGLSVALASGTACTSNPPETCPSKEISLDSVDYVDEIPAYPITEEEDDSSDTENNLDDVIEGEVDIDPDYKKAQFPGGYDSLKSFLQKNLHYPQEAVEKSIEGRVVVSFIVDKYGHISNVEVVQSADSLLDTEAVRWVQSMPDWSPAEMDGKAVRSRFVLPVKFGLYR
mgnify:CR=1 FL=1|jgi:TonB family protein